MRTSGKLRHLAAWLDGMPDKYWNFSTFRRDTKCGTVGCAAGHLMDAFTDCPPLFMPRHAYPEKSLYFVFDMAEASQFLGLDERPKRRPSDKNKWPRDDFERMFCDEDRRLRDEACCVRLVDVPKHAVTARLRRMADHYASMGR